MKKEIYFDLGNVIIITNYNKFNENIYANSSYDKEVIDNSIKNLYNLAFYGFLNKQEILSVYSKIANKVSYEFINEMSEKIEVKVNKDIINFIKENKSKYTFGIISDIDEFTFHLVEPYIKEVIELIDEDKIFLSFKYKFSKYFNTVEAINLISSGDKCKYLIDDSSEVIKCANMHGVNGIKYSFFEDFNKVKIYIEGKNNDKAKK